MNFPMTIIVVCSKICGAEVEQVTSYKYLGCVLPVDRDNQTTEIHNRLCLTRSTFGKLKDVLKLEKPTS